MMFLSGCNLPFPSVQTRPQATNSSVTELHKVRVCVCVCVCVRERETESERERERQTMQGRAVRFVGWLAGAAGISVSVISQTLCHCDPGNRK